MTVTWTATPSSAHLERQIITGMIVSDRVLRILGLSYKPQYMAAESSREIARWCLTYQEKYGKAPKSDIQILFEAHKRNGLSPESAQLIGQALSSLSQEFERAEFFNEQLAIDTAINYFRERALTLLRDDLTFHLEGGNLSAANASVAEFYAPAGHISLGFEPFSDMDGMRESFEDRSSLFSLPGTLGKMIGPFERECLVMVVGKYKGAKSFTCQYIAQQAFFSGLNVAWFDFELGERRLRRRFAQGLCAMPLKHLKNNQLLIPVWDCSLNQSGECYKPVRSCQITLLNDKKKPKFKDAPFGYKPCTSCKEGSTETWLEERPYSVLEWGTAWRKAQAVIGSVVGARIRIQSWPKFSAGVKDMKATLSSWRYLENFTPDLIVVDQPDDMFMEGHGDTRHKIDELWKHLAAIPQELHCCLVAPSQAGGKDAQERSRLRVSDVAEDSRKLGHVDMSIRIDQTETDTLAQRAIFSVGVGRDDEATGERVMALQALSLGQAVLDSKAL